MNADKNIILILFAFFFTSFSHSQKNSIDLLIIGGGASGTTAGIQAARMGVKTIILEESNWLGGMLTSAGVSAIDGNHHLPSGLWGEFRGSLYDYYGGRENLGAGWVSHTLFEPSVGNNVLKQLAQLADLDIWYESKLNKVTKKNGLWEVSVNKKGKKSIILAKVLIDATELGDVLAAVGAQYDVGMNSNHETGESMAPDVANDIIQDLTYVVILKDFGKASDMTIPKPDGYDRMEFNCATDVSDPAGDGVLVRDTEMMMTYGKLPNNKYMINWPKCGNDIYLNVIEMSPKDRELNLRKAKAQTLRFIYYIQNELGYRNLGIARDEFPTSDGFPMIPYHRESRLVKGLSRLTVNHMARPFEQNEAYYRTGIAVGDYPIDHHHLKNPEAPLIDFINIKIPAYNVPLGALIPQGVDGLIVAEKSISVTNIVNGATRLQPVVLGIGQAAGALASVVIKTGVEPRNVSIRQVQQALLEANAYVMPYRDVAPESEYFMAVQRIGATGIMKGVGVPYKWANETWFYPSREISEYEFVEGLETYFEINGHAIHPSGKALTLKFFAEVMAEINSEIAADNVQRRWKSLGFEIDTGSETLLNRGKTAMMIDALLNPFGIEIDFNGHIKQ